ncbi:outer membrane protein assembly factor BamE [Tropicibacter naphthalenivorans]|uniref:SmpA / OmlA family protein n=1 Tax=Tropicibacter naphthalenivorans TaxID=441103 RepID=A0A0P1G670_9RHOB|nr:outer membrane protein assembly factor BamE [Tropicibacter naphthalenivorans]CUH77254.1 SmpA / OmlA family protein [Tropicibacter naphthalenivorans]SMC59549.1 Beta-barrel assembly machine subunit BamE [Tropicibacter naphthalenivorans]
MRSMVGFAKVTVAACVLATLGACTAQYRTHGYMPPEDELSMIVPGVDTRASVEDLIGVPNAAGVLNDSGYYYIETDVRQFAWQAPEIVDRQILAITFDQAGVVENLTTYGLEDGQVVPLTRRVTRTSDGDIGFIKKLFGNIGGLNAADLLGN